MSRVPGRLDDRGRAGIGGPASWVFPNARLYKALGESPTLGPIPLRASNEAPPPSHMNLQAREGRHRVSAANPVLAAAPPAKSEASDPRFAGRIAGGGL